MRNFQEWVLAFQAVTSMGAIAVTMNSHWQPDAMNFGLRDCGAKVLFADPERFERLAPIADPPPEEVIAVRTPSPPPGVDDLKRFRAELGEVVDATVYAAADLDLAELKAFLSQQLALFELPATSIAPKARCLARPRAKS